MTENESSGLDRTDDPIEEWAQRGLTAPAERASISPAGPGSAEAADAEEANFSEQANHTESSAETDPSAAAGT